MIQRVQPGEYVTIADGVEFQCRCGARCVVSSGGKSVMHEIPMCDEFEAMPVTDFLAWVNAGKVS